MQLTPLTPEESRIIKDKKTEFPFTSEYWNHFKPGIYTCRQCGLPLFDAKAKFDAGCGWPSFDASFPNAVKETLDADGERTEILCARCGGHLGHVFRGEQHTAADTRHCANSLSLRFVPADKQEAYLAQPDHQLQPKEIVLGGGCFWCIEAALLRVPGVLNSVSGYAGGTIPHPRYEQVCSGSTWHAEVVKITYDSGTLSLSQLLELFFLAHDATSLNKQEYDTGTEYRSIIFYASEEEKKEIEAFIAKKQAEYSKPIVTEVVPLTEFYPAEPIHQRYFENHPNTSYCRIIVSPKVEKIDKMMKK